MADHEEETEADHVVFTRSKGKKRPEKTRSYPSQQTLKSMVIVANNFDTCDTTKNYQDDNMNQHNEDAEPTNSGDKRSSGCWKNKRFKCFRKMLLPIIGLLLYGGDIYTDIALAMQYISDGEKSLAVYTIAFLCIPAFLIMLMDISWHYIDGDAKGVAKRNRQNADGVGTSSDGTERDPLDLKWWLRTFLSIMTVGIIGMLWRTCQYTKYFMEAARSPSKEDHDDYKRRARNIQRDCYTFNFIEAFLESAPQLALQLYITYAFDKPFSHERLRSMILSTASITWNYCAYYRCNRANAANKEDIKCGPFAILLLSTCFCIVPRFVCVMLFLVFFKSNDKCIIISIILVVHVVLVFIWIFKINPKLKGTVVSKKFKYLYYGFFSYVQFFLFINLQGSKTKKSQTILYFFIYLENTLLAVFLAVYRMPELGKSKDACILLCLPVGFCVHVVCLMIFYGVCHPKTGSAKTGCCKL